MDGSHERDEEERRALAELMDPAALERRLGDARIRRAAALAAREPPDAPPPPPPQPSPRRKVLIPGMFVAGALAGAALVAIGPQALERLTAPTPVGPEAVVELAQPPPPGPFASRAAIAPSLAPAPPARVAMPAALPDRPLASPLADVRIVVNAPPGADASGVAAAMDALDAANPAGLIRADARVTISASNVRYFHAADREAAMETAALLAPALGAAPQIRDFTDFNPPPSPGAIEVWLEGAAPSTVARRRSAGPDPAAIVMETLRRARQAMDRAIDQLPGAPGR